MIKPSGHDRFAAMLSALGSGPRLAVFRLLVRRAPGGAAAGEISSALGIGASTLSRHLDILAQAGLVDRTREGVSVRYRLAAGAATALVDYLVVDCLRGRAGAPPKAANDLSHSTSQRDRTMTEDKKFNVLFICVGNSARSIFAECLMRELGGGKFNAYSAGVHHYDALNPYAVDLLRKNSHSVDGLRPKSVNEFQGDGAPPLDFVFTVCDDSANEDCPAWEDQPISSHWNIPDPVKATGNDGERAVAFNEAYRMLRQRISTFVELPIASLDRVSLQSQVDAIETDAVASA